MEPQRYGPFPYTPINRRPKITWPDGKRLALWVIPNIETFPLNEPVPGGTGMAPDIINWAPRDYGARVGVFRIMEVLEKHGPDGGGERLRPLIPVERLDILNGIWCNVFENFDEGSEEMRPCLSPEQSRPTRRI